MEGEGDKKFILLEAAAAGALTEICSKYGTTTVCSWPRFSFYSPLDGLYFILGTLLHRKDRLNVKEGKPEPLSQGLGVSQKRQFNGFPIMVDALRMGRDGVAVVDRPVTSILAAYLFRNFIPTKMKRKT